MQTLLNGSRLWNTKWAQCRSHCGLVYKHRIWLGNLCLHYGLLNPDELERESSPEKPLNISRDNCWLLPDSLVEGTSRCLSKVHHDNQHLSPPVTCILGHELHFKVKRDTVTWEWWRTESQWVTAQGSLLWSDLCDLHPRYGLTHWGHERHNHSCTHVCVDQSVPCIWMFHTSNHLLNEPAQSKVSRKKREELIDKRYRLTACIIKAAFRWK